MYVKRGSESSGDLRPNNAINKVLDFQSDQEYAFVAQSPSIYDKQDKLKPGNERAFTFSSGGVPRPPQPSPDDVI